LGGELARDRGEACEALGQEIAVLGDLGDAAEALGAAQRALDRLRFEGECGGDLAHPRRPQPAVGEQRAVAPPQLFVGAGEPRPMAAQTPHAALAHRPAGFGEPQECRGENDELLDLHYAFDLWVHAWRQRHAHHDVIVVRFADDIVMGFQSERDTRRFQSALAERFRKFHLDLHPEKTRLIEFGPFAAANRRQRGDGKPETFDFLGFTHICARKRSNGRFTVLRQTVRKRLQAKLSEVKAELQLRRHDPIPDQGSWLRSVVGGTSATTAGP
jgi:hypothetical protein